MKQPIIIEGKPFDWARGHECALQAVHEDGTINWRAAFSADPGVLSCPFCDESMWWEGTVVECPTCHMQVNTNWRSVATEARGYDPVVRRLDNKTNANITRILHAVCEAVRKGAAFNLPRDTPPLIRDFARAAQSKPLKQTREKP